MSSSSQADRVALGNAAAALGKPRVADPPPYNRNSPAVARTACAAAGENAFGDALIALAVVVGADVEIRMSFAAVPADDLVRCRRSWRTGL